SGIGRHHLPAVLGLDHRRRRVVFVPGVVAHAGAVRDHSQAGCRRPRALRARRVRLVQSPDGADQEPQWVQWSILRSGRPMMIYAAMLIAVGLAFWRLPAGFLPIDDQGFITTDVLTPPDASFPRTLEAVKRVEDYLVKPPAVDTLTFLTGFSFLGQGQNTAQAFITLKDWSQRGEAESAERIVADINRTFAALRDGKISALQPPPIDNLGNSSGFISRLQDRGQRGYAALMRASDQLLAAAAAS